MKTGEPVESLSLSKILVLYMRKYQITSLIGPIENPFQCGAHRNGQHENSNHRGHQA